MDLLVVFVVLYVLAATCFLGFALGAAHPKINLLGLGVFFWALVPLIQTLQKL